jgi:hypothetical protein
LERGFIGHFPISCRAFELSDDDRESVAAIVEQWTATDWKHSR